MKTPFETTARDEAPSFIPSPTSEFYISACAEGPPGELRLLILSGPRGEGKCLQSDARIIMADGRLLPINTVPAGRLVAVDHDLNLKDAENCPAESYGVQRCLRLKTASGYDLIGNLEHPFLRLDGWTPLRDLRPGDLIATLRRCPIEGTQRLPDMVSEFAGLMMGDGGCTGSCRFSGRDPEVVQYVESICSHFGWNIHRYGYDLGLTLPQQPSDMRLCCQCGEVKPRAEFVGCPYCRPCSARYLRDLRRGIHRLSVAKWSDRGPVALLRRLGLAGKTSYTKRVPDQIFTAPNDQVAAFIGAYFACDGTVASPKRRLQIEFSSVSRGMLADVKHLLLRFGIVATLRQKRGTYKGRRHNSWRLIINGPFVRRFAEAVPVIGVKRHRLQEAISRPQRDNTNTDIIPVGWTKLLRRGEKWHQLRGVRWARANRYGHGRGVVERVARNEGNEALLRLAASEIYWDRIIALEDVGEHEVFNVEVPGPHTFIADGGVVTHNTTSGLIACVELAARLAREGRHDALPLRIAVVRDSWVNISRTTLVSFEENQRKGLPLEWREGRHEAIVTFDVPYCHFYFFGLDDAQSADKLQGFACGVFWLEEVAPAAGLATGIPAEVLGLGVTCLRQPNMPYQRMLITMNPPDSDAWVLRVEDHLSELNIPHIRVHHAVIPAGEKSEHFRVLAQETGGEEAALWGMAADEFDRYRERNKVFLESIGRTDLVARLVEGQVGEVQLGDPVVPNFSPEHIAKEALPVYRTLPILRAWDNEPSPACCLMQVLPDGAGVNVLGSHSIENQHIEGFIDAWLLPFMAKYGLMPGRGQTAGGWGRGPRAGLRYEDVGDPVLLNSQLSAGQVIMAKLGTTLAPGAIDWDERRGAALACFARSASKGSRRFVLLDPTENDLLIQGLKGRFRFPRQMSTGVATMTAQAAKRASGKWSNACDSLFYGLAYRFPAAEWLRRHQRTPVPRVPLKKPASFMGV